MILELLIRLFFGIVDLVISLIPQVELPAGVTEGISDLSYLFSFATYFIPVGTVLGCITLIFLIDNIKFLVSIFNWIISKIPTIS